VLRFNGLILKIQGYMEAINFEEGKEEGRKIRWWRTGIMRWCGGGG
jgi:hypothetical protein